MKDDRKQTFEESFEHLDEKIIAEFAGSETDPAPARKTFFARFTSHPVRVAACAVFALAFVIAGAMLLRSANTAPRDGENAFSQAESAVEVNESAPYSAPEESAPEFSAEPAYSEPTEESAPVFEFSEESEPEIEESWYEPTEGSEEVSEPVEELSEDNETGFIRVNKGVSYLSAEVFSSSRAAYDVSEAFKNHYLSFAADLFKKVAKGKSAFISPLSALTALQMAANGAASETAEEMQKVLGGELSTEQLNQELFNYYESLRNTEYASLKCANSVWMTDDEHFSVNRRFVNITNDTFRAALVCAPLAKDSTVDAINDWCDKTTDGMIPKLLEYGDLDPNTVMVLLNSLSFDGIWDAQYSDDMCKEKTFHGETRDTAVKMMLTRHNGFISGEHETGFVLCFKRFAYGFAAIMPEEGMSIEEYLASLDGEKLASLLNYSYDDVMTGLPEFSFDWSGSLKDVLIEMGVEQAFLPEADFSQLGVMDDGTNIFIGDVYQKTRIEVDQSGTRAAAITEVGMAGGVFNPEYEEVILDRPFVYVIFDMANKLPIFIGCITDIG